MGPWWCRRCTATTLWSGCQPPRHSCLPWSIDTMGVITSVRPLSTHTHSHIPTHAYALEANPSQPQPHTYTHIHTYAQTYIYIYIRTDTQKHLFRRCRTRTHTHAHIPSNHTATHTHAHTHARARRRMSRPILHRNRIAQVPLLPPSSRRPGQIPHVRDPGVQPDGRQQMGVVGRVLSRFAEANVSR